MGREPKSSKEKIEDSSKAYDGAVLDKTKNKAIKTYLAMSIGSRGKTVDEIVDTTFTRFMKVYDTEEITENIKSMVDCDYVRKSGPGLYLTEKGRGLLESNGLFEVGAGELLITRKGERNMVSIENYFRKMSAKNANEMYLVF